MKIIGPNFLSNRNLSPVEELNLRDGQKIIGKVISTSTDEALLEIAGHNCRAKIEGEPHLQSGAVFKFLVKHDSQGRVLLKIFNEAEETNISNKGGASVKRADGDNLQKVVQTALIKEGLPVSQEHVNSIVRLLQGFQSKYQQSLPPQVLTFLTAHGLPINSETIMTAWVFKDPELRNLLWNMLRQFGSSDFSRAGVSILSRLIIGMSSNSKELQTKLQTLAKHLDTIMRHSNENQNAPSISQELNNPLRQPAMKNRQVDGLSRQFNQVGNGQMKDKTAPNFIEHKNPLLNELKGLISKLTTTFERKELREKVEVLLDRNMALNKAILQEDNINSNYNLVPFLINDSNNILHEILIKWREEKDQGKAGKNEQFIQLNIPTENLGEIHLALRSGWKGTQITFKVDNDNVRKYLLKNLIELKENFSRKDVKIGVELVSEDNLVESSITGVDLWI